MTDKPLKLTEQFIKDNYNDMELSDSAQWIKIRDRQWKARLLQLQNVRTKCQHKKDNTHVRCSVCYEWLQEIEKLLAELKE